MILYLSYVDIIFTALPNGEAQLISKDLLKKNTLIDLAADFRLKKGSDYLRWYKVIYDVFQLVYFSKCDDVTYKDIYIDNVSLPISS